MKTEKKPLNQNHFVCKFSRFLKEFFLGLFMYFWIYFALVGMNGSKIVLGNRKGAFIKTHRKIFRGGVKGGGITPVDPSDCKI